MDEQRLHAAGILGEHPPFERHGDAARQRRDAHAGIGAADDPVAFAAADIDLSRAAAATRA